MPADILTYPETLTCVQLDSARTTYASMVIEGTSLSEARAMEIAGEFFASDLPDRIAAVPTRAGMTYDEMVAEFKRAGLLGVDS